MLVALGEKTIELAGRCMDGVVLHTFFADEAMTNSVAAARRGAEQAGRDPGERSGVVGARHRRRPHRRSERA